MGQIAFDLPPDLPPDRAEIPRQAWLAGGYDASPVPTKRHEANGRLTLTRAENESVFVAVPWKASDGFERVVTSGTLRLTQNPYPLLTELARGAVNRVRSLVAMFGSAGLTVPQSVADAVGRVTKQFGRVVLKSDTSTATACDVIDAACDLADGCAAVLTDERLRSRLNTDGPLPTRLGCRLSKPLPPDQAEAFKAAFHAVRIVPDWRRIEPRESSFDWSDLDALVEWATGAGLDISVGPLVDLADGPFPDWMTAWAGDLPNLAAFMADYVGNITTRYRREVRHWQAFAGFNHADAFGLSEDDRIRLAARVLEAVQDAAPKADRTFAVSQPWGEYLTSEDHTYAPLVFADTLLRAGFQVAALDLELIGGTPRGGFARDPLDTLQLFQQFEQLGLPLEITLGSAVPALLPTVLGAPTVRAVYWDSWSAADPSARVPAAPLWAGGRTDRLDALRAARRDWLRGPTAG